MAKAGSDTRRGVMVNIKLKLESSTGMVSGEIGVQVGEGIECDGFVVLFLEPVFFLGGGRRWSVGCAGAER